MKNGDRPDPVGDFLNNLLTLTVFSEGNVETISLYEPEKSSEILYSRGQRKLQPEHSVTSR